MSRLVLALLLAVAMLTGCGEDTVPPPPGVSFQVEQTRLDLQGRHFEVQVVNHGRRDLRVDRAEFESGRLDEPTHYEGPAPVAAGTAVNLKMTMPQARCGRGIDARVRVTYAVGDEPAVTSVARPKDHYGSVERFMTRDCAERAVGRIDKRLEMQGTGDDATLRLDLTFTPPESGDLVHLDSVVGSTLLAPAGPDATEIDRDLEPGGERVTASLDFVPNRCDAHVVSEDRTGGILPLRVESKAFGKSPVYLRFSEAQKAQIFDYLAERCGFGTH